MPFKKGPVTIYRAELDDDGSPAEDSSYYRLPSPEKPYVLQFKVIAGALASNGGVLWTNYPESDSTPFDRNLFNHYRLTGLEPSCDIQISRSGAFEYYVEHSPVENTNDGSVSWSRSKTGFFIVDPKLLVTKVNRPKKLVSTTAKANVSEQIHLPLEGLVIESVVPKWMGRFSQWTPHLETIAQSGYNMIHFVPLQERGISNSPYSIFDQLRFDPSFFEEADRKKSVKDQREIVKGVISKIENDFGCLSLTDVVWNHTACNSTWLWDHPEGGYNLHNSPHLIPAFELDEALLQFSATIADPTTPLPADIKTDQDLEVVMKALRNTVFASIRFWEFYVVDVKTSVELFRVALKKGITYDRNLFDHGALIRLSFKDQAAVFTKGAIVGSNEHGGRFHKKPVVEIALAFMASYLAVDLTNSASYVLEDVVAAYHKMLDEVNLVYYKVYDQDVDTIATNVESRIKYIRLAENGPRLGPINENNPLVETYFTRLPKNEQTMKHPEGSRFLVNNGWIWNADPLADFAGKGSHSYLRREVIIWGDCVKLRYGKGPEDVPWLWKHMTEYTVESAKLFHGFRIDNCHSTPLHLAQHLLDAAREVRPDLYVVAELFTGSEAMDIRFVSRLGINSLIREAMQAWDPKELSRLVHRHGYKPVGCMDQETLVEEINWVRPDGTPALTRITPLNGSHPHALFMDCTHDNETPHQKRRAEDTLPNAALVCMTSCAIGSVKGYDELYPSLLNLVSESRLYKTYDQPMEVGINNIRAILNKLHIQMALEGFEESHVHHEGEYIIVHRQQPQTLKGYILVAHTSFYDNPKRGDIAPIKLRGTTAKTIFSVGLEVTSRSLKPNKDFLEGLDSKIVQRSEPYINKKWDQQGAYTEVVVPDDFAGGSVMLLESVLEESVVNNVDEVVRTISPDVFAKLNWVDLNIVLYRCEGEEQDTTPGNGAYNVPNYGSLVYCGLEGYMSMLKVIVRNNDLGHPFCAHLREGHWALDYVIDRIQRHLHLFPNLEPLMNWYKDRMAIIKTLPNYLVPRYFGIVIMTAYETARKHAYSLMTPLIRNGDFFTRSLSLTAIQVYGYVDSTSLHPTKKGPCLAAGLPHFTFRHMRTWGRDVFISLRGIFMVTGQYQAAKDHILGFASSLKHGTIPNLLDSVRAPRYNSRDSVWWFFQSVQDYCTMVPNGESILKESVLRRFPLNDTFVTFDDPKAYSYSSTLAEILQEILSRHANGIHYREYNAGRNLDEQMSDKGFQVDVDLDWNTGFVTGGSVHNCGTWMDKMGESAKAGTKGVPATPRDGADVEIVGMLKSALRWVIELNKRGLFPYKGVEIEAKVVQGVSRPQRTFLYTEWNQLIQNSFEHCFYVPLDPVDDGKYVINPKLVNRRGMYKDTFGSATPFTDYQLRPNVPVAMCVAPELFDKDHALDALLLIKETLLGPMGMRTLDPSDWAYRPNYDNQNDTEDRMVAKGWNYHQGPEWLWCTGYFFRAYLAFSTRCIPSQTKRTVFELHRMLLPHKAHLETSPWAGLPELTNLEGAHCKDSCASQAWSSSTIIDLLHDMNQLGEAGQL